MYQQIKKNGNHREAKAKQYSKQGILTSRCAAVECVSAFFHAMKCTNKYDD